ncbi:hypothetical protein C7H19_24280 [Aphanothece hegewaldii CCALA 016]|uniref:Uncharacterized protein n=1 Tax=Aphanothece hegewaldii CCALA 016 TaxID=2107694 RepID=A0A2T1LQQ2_9CHRO|nr:hypothetical protein [Aphanothece hegewaldii]PSF29440.1 hypothetical protein C7H19_24280 [Aphanothece hegewaldii CCALA 016]
MPSYRNLDKSPRIFFMPGDQIFPWAIIFGLCFVILKKVLGLSWIWVIVTSGWGMATWWVLTFGGMYAFFGRLVETPNWTRAIVPYQPVLSSGEAQSQRKRNRRLLDE